MKIYALLAVLFITACSDSNNENPPAGDPSANPASNPDQNPASNPDQNPDQSSGENPAPGPNPNLGPIIGEDSLPLILQSQLETFFEMANGAALQEMSAILLHIVSPIESGFTLLSSRTEESDLTNRDLYSCTGGGTVEVWKSSSADNANEPRNNATATDCGFGTRVVSGEFYLTDPINQSEANYLLVSVAKNYTVSNTVDESTTSLVAGEVRYNSVDPTGIPRTAISWDADTLSVSRLASSYSIGSAESRVSDPSAPLPDSSLGRTTNLNALVLSNELRQVRTPQAFQRPANTENFTTGIMTVVSNKSSVELDANSGADSTFLLTETKDGVTTTYGVQWSNRYQFKVLDPANTDLNLGEEALP